MTVCVFELFEYGIQIPVFRYCSISDFKIGQLRTTDDGEHGRGPGSRLPAHAHFGVSSVLRCVVARDGVFSRIFV